MCGCGVINESFVVFVLHDWLFLFSSCLTLHVLVGTSSAEAETEDKTGAATKSGDYRWQWFLPCVSQGPDWDETKWGDRPCQCQQVSFTGCIRSKASVLLCFMFMYFPLVQFVYRSFVVFFITARIIYINPSPSTKPSTLIWLKIPVFKIFMYWWC